MTIPDLAEDSYAFNVHAAPCPVPNSDRNNLEDVEGELVETGFPLANPKAQHSLHKSDINDIHDPIIGRVPLEIASYIFELYVKWHSTGSNEAFACGDLMTATGAPLRLGSICKKWRAVAWSSPQLWTTLIIDIFTRKHKETAPLVLDWMARTGALPLSIQLYSIRSSYTVDAREDAITLITIINRFFARWGSVDINIPSDLMVHVSGASGDENIQTPSTLRYLRLSRNDDAWGIDSDSPETALFSDDSAPRHFPTHISLYSFALNEFSVGWSNVTNFDAGGLLLEECLEVFQRAPRLEKCKFYEFRSDELELSYPSITHSALRSFSVSDTHGESPELVIETLLDHMTLPSLQEFHCYGTDDSLFMRLISLIERSSCQLTCLHLGDPVMTDHELLRLLEQIPSLTTLSLTLHENDIGHLFRQLAKAKGTATEQPFLPNLQVLRIRSPQHFSWEALPDLFYTHQLHSGQTSEPIKPYMLHRQALQITLLLAGELRKSDYIDKTTLKRLRELKKQGINPSIIQWSNDNNSSMNSSICQSYIDDEEEAEGVVVNFIAKSERFHFGRQ